MMGLMLTGRCASFRVAQLFFAIIISAVLIPGCASVGPPTVDRDRFDYVSAISESWKRQTLLNLVKTRYMDAPVFMDVASVISQYALEGEIETGFRWDKADSQTLGGRAQYTDRPTISYAPLTGENFARNLLRPIPVGTILLLIQSGYPIDYILRSCVQGINGLDNHTGRAFSRQGDPEFYELLGLLRQVQLMDGIRLRALASETGQKVVVYFNAPETPAHSQSLEKALHLLGLCPDAREFRVVNGFIAGNDREVAIMSRSMLQIMSGYAAYIEVPDSDILEGRVVETRREESHNGSQLPPLIRVHCSPSKPDDVYISVPYRDHWFYIDDRDIESKQSFSFLMVMFSFTERGDIANMRPVLTVPTN